jgi:hypothetical protein
MLMRGTLSQNWVSEIQNVVKSYNSTPIQKLGWIEPRSIHSEIDSVRVEEAQKKNNLNIYREPNFEQQIQNQKNYESNLKNLQVGQYVYLDFDEKVFSKSFDVQVYLSKKVSFFKYLRFLIDKTLIVLIVTYFYVQDFSSMIKKNSDKIEKNL